MINETNPFNLKRGDKVRVVRTGPIGWEDSVDWAKSAYESTVSDYPHETTTLSVINAKKPVAKITGSLYSFHTYHIAPIKTVIYISTLREYINVVSFLISDMGRKWGSGSTLMERNNFFERNNCCIHISKPNGLLYNSKEIYNTLDYKIIPASEFLGETEEDVILRKGSRGCKVATWQDKLKKCGFDPGTLDAVFGPKTEDAVISFQYANNLVPDGEIGPRTKEALECISKNSETATEITEKAKHLEFMTSSPVTKSDDLMGEPLFDNGIAPLLKIEQERLLSKEKKKIKHKTMSIIKDIFKTKEQRALEYFDLVNGDGGLTRYGRGEFIDYLWETEEDARKKFVKKIVETYKEETGN